MVLKESVVCWSSRYCRYILGNNILFEADTVHRAHALEIKYDHGDSREFHLLGYNLF